MISNKYYFTSYRVTKLAKDFFDKWMIKFKKELLTFSPEAISKIEKRLLNAIEGRLCMLPNTDYDTAEAIIEQVINPEQILIESVA